MQCTDVFYLKADICQLGLDQRKVNMLAREYCEKIGKKDKPVILSHSTFWIRNVKWTQRGSRKNVQVGPRFRYLHGRFWIGGENQNQESLLPARHCGGQSHPRLYEMYCLRSQNPAAHWTKAWKRRQCVKVFFMVMSGCTIRTKIWKKTIRNNWCTLATWSPRWPKSSMNWFNPWETILRTMPMPRAFWNKCAASLSPDECLFK